MDEAGSWPVLASKLISRCFRTVLIIIYGILEYIGHSLAHFPHKVKTSIPSRWLYSLQGTKNHSPVSLDSVQRGLNSRQPPPPSSSAVISVGEVLDDINSDDKVVYADYAGAPPYPPSVLESSLQDLLTGVYGNPHSEHGWGGSGSSSEATERLRELTLSLCHASPEDYVCVLTSGATAALKLVGEAFPWTQSSTFVHLADNHNSVLGIRELAIQSGAAVGVVSAADISIKNKSLSSEIDSAAAKEALPTEPAEPADTPTHLFAFPLESNFSGVRYQESLTTAIQQQTASLCCTTTLKNNNSAISWYAGEAPSPQPPPSVPLLKSNGTSSLAPPLSPPLLPNGQWRVLLDAAKACGTHPPNLSHHQPDFLALSYYKIFGCPTGLGALLVKRDALGCLTNNKKYFGGGTLLASVAEERFHVRRHGTAGLEDGTLPFLSIPVALRGFEWLESIGGVREVESEAVGVARCLANTLEKLRHSNGAPVCLLHGAWNTSNIVENKANEANISNTTSSPTKDSTKYDDYKSSIVAGQGPVVTFSVLRPDGGWVGHREVERIAALEGVMLRTGAMCNPGALREALDLETEEMKRWYEAGHVCWDDTDIIDGSATGAIRASFGHGSTNKHANVIAAVIRRHFLVQKPQTKTQTQPMLAKPPLSTTLSEKSEPTKEHSGLFIKSMFIYPIKSCAAFKITSSSSSSSWPLCSSGGLFLDRHWALVAADGRALTLKRCPALSRIKPTVDLDSGILRISAGSLEDPLEISLPVSTRAMFHDTKGVQGSDSTSSCLSSGGHAEIGKGAAISANNSADVVHLCARTVGGTSSTSTNCITTDYNEASAWFQRQLGVYCRLVEHQTSDPAPLVPPLVSGPGSFANEAQLLVVTEASLNDLQARSGLLISWSREEFAARFRPNIILGGGGGGGSLESSSSSDDVAPYEEERWSALSIAGVQLKIDGPCPRCYMVCLNPEDGRKTGSEPLLSLASRTSACGKRMCFGVLVNAVSAGEEGPTSLTPTRHLFIGMPVQGICL